MTAVQTSLDRGDGHLVTCVQISPTRAVGRMSPKQFLAIVADPRDADLQSDNPDLREIALIRKDVQRPFEGAKKANVPRYAAYITSLAQGDPGITPSILLYSSEPLETDFDDHGQGHLLIPYGTPMPVLDGETQTAARIDAARVETATLLGYFPVEVIHGVKHDVARQMFHDLNTLGVRPNAALAISMDMRDPLTFITRKVANLPFFQNRVEMQARQLGRKSASVVTLTALRGAVVCFAEGISGVRYGVKPVAILPERLPGLEASALRWFDAVATRIGSAMENRDKTVAASPAVLAALGAVGRDIVSEVGEAAQIRKCNEVIRKVDGVKWERTAWVGIAGKQTPKGKVTLGGSKETAYAVHSALTDPDSEGYAQVRR